MPIMLNYNYQQGGHMLHINKTTLRKHKKAILISSGAIIAVIAVTVLGFAMPGIIRSYKHHVWQKQQQAKVDRYLNKSLKISFGDFSTDVRDGNIVGNFKVTVKNISDKMAYYNVTIDAITPKGNTVSSETIKIDTLPPQQEKQFFVFNRALSPHEERLLKVSTFKVTDINPFQINIPKESTQNNPSSQDSNNATLKAAQQPTQKTADKAPSTKRHKRAKH